MNLGEEVTSYFKEKIVSNWAHGRNASLNETLAGLCRNTAGPVRWIYSEYLLQVRDFLFLPDTKSFAASVAWAPSWWSTLCYQYVRPQAQVGALMAVSHLESEQKWYQKERNDDDDSSLRQNITVIKQFVTGFIFVTELRQYLPSKESKRFYFDMKSWRQNYQLHYEEKTPKTLQCVLNF